MVSSGFRRYSSIQLFFLLILFVVGFTSPRSFAAKKDDSPYHLSSMPIFNRTILLIKEQYVDPTRFRPREMLIASLNAVEQKVPEIVVDEPQGDSIGVHVGTKHAQIAIGTLNSLWDLSFKLREFFQFFEANLPTETNLREIEYVAVNGTLSVLDPHSNLLEPSYSSELHLNAKGEFGGLGVVIGIRDGVLTVISPIDGTPAARVGVKALDRVVKIGEEATINMPLDEAVNLLRGEPGSTANLTIERKGESSSINVDIVREIIKIESVSKNLLSGNVGYIKVKAFHANTASDVESMLQKLKNETKGKLRGVVLDFRNNPGGLLDQSIKIADLFLDGGVVVSTQVANVDRIEKQFASSGKSKTELPVIVLVNGGSASASEIVAGAIKNRDRGLVLGQQTFGKGSVQMVFDFPDRSSLKLTVAQYLTPGNESIQSVGITPDFEVNPVFASDVSSIAMFGKGFPREEDQEAHLDNEEKVVAHKSRFSLKYLDVKPTLEELEHRMVSNKLVEDFEIKLAKRILIETKGPTREELFKSAENVLTVASTEEELKILSALKKLGINWSNPGQNPLSPKLSVRVTKQSIGKAGGELEIQLQAENLGKEPLYQVYGISKSKTGLLEGREILFGKLEPGEKKRLSLKVNLPKDSLPRRDFVRVNFNGNGTENIAAVDVPVEIQGLPRPVFAYSAFIDDSRNGNGDGYLQSDEKVDLIFALKNIGKGDANEPVILLKNLGGPEIFIDEGRKKLKAIKAGQSVKDKLSFTVRSEAKLAKLEVYIYDAEMGVLWTEKMEIPVRTKAPEIIKTSGRVRFNEETVLFEEPSSGTPAITKIAAGSEGEQLLKIKDMVRVRFSSTLSGFVKASSITPLDSMRNKRGKTSEFTNSEYRRVPPKIELAGKEREPIIAKELFRLDVKVTDESALKDAWIFVNNKKVYYRQFNQEGPSSIEFSTDVKLKAGVNFITMVAREDASYAQRKTISVFSEVGDPLEKIQSHQH